MNNLHLKRQCENCGDWNLKNEMLIYLKAPVCIKCFIELCKEDKKPLEEKL